MTPAADRGVRTDDALVAQGWVRRFMADPDRAAEARDTYQAAGFEVRLQALQPADFGAACVGCAATICAAYVVLYTRKNEPEAP